MSDIRYTTSLEGVRAEQLEGLHVGWPKPPSPATFLKSLRNMNAVVLAIDAEAGRVIGFVCGMTDETLILYVWDSEVLAAYRGAGIEQELLRRLLEAYGDIYQVNAHPQKDSRGLFAELGFTAYHADDALAMTKMNYDWQDGGPRAAPETT